MARWDAGLTVDQRAWVIGYGRLGFRPARASAAAEPIITVRLERQEAVGHPARLCDEMGADFLADPVVVSAIKAYRKHLNALALAPVTKAEAEALLSDLMRAEDVDPSARVKAVVEMAKLKGWGKEQAAKLRLAEAQADAVEVTTKAKQPGAGAGVSALMVVPIPQGEDEWDVVDVHPQARPTVDALFPDADGAEAPAPVKRGLPWATP